MAAPGKGTVRPGPGRGPSHAHPDALDDLEDGCKRAEEGSARRGLSIGEARWRRGSGGAAGAPPPPVPTAALPLPFPPPHLIRKPRK